MTPADEIRGARKALQEKLSAEVEHFEKSTGTTIYSLELGHSIRMGFEVNPTVRVRIREV